MLQFAVDLLHWLPRFFVWLVVPIACVSMLLAPMRRSRLHAALGFMIAASISAIFLALETVALGYICCDQARMLLTVLLDFRPGVTMGFTLALVGTIVKPLIGVLPMLIGAAVTGTGAFLLRRGSRATVLPSNELVVARQSETVS